MDVQMSGSEAIEWLDLEVDNGMASILFREK